MSELSILQNAMGIAVGKLNLLGTPCTYTHKDTGLSNEVPVLIRELSSDELVGDYRQGDLKVELDATKINSKPMKYDTLLIQGQKYSVMSPSGAARRAGAVVYTYKFIVRGA